MYTYQITDEGIEKLKAYKELHGEVDGSTGVVFVNGMFLGLDSENKRLSLSYEIEHRFYLGLQYLLKDDVKLVGANSITYVGDKQ